VTAAHVGDGQELTNGIEYKLQPVKGIGLDT
jgi:hypothetical protein